MKSTLRRKWRLILICLILVLIAIGIAIGPLVVKVFGTIIGIFAILAIIISGNDGGGGIDPENYQSGATGNQGGLGGF